MSRIRSHTPPPMDDLRDPAHDAKDFAIAAARIAADDRIEDVEVIDLRGLSGVADFFVLGTGTSERQMSAVIEHLRLFGKDLNRKPMGLSDAESGSWLLVDFVDVVVHLFDREHRAYYDLDGLWGDAPRVDWRVPGRETASADAGPTSGR
jgi:ribosome-associated protein